MRLWTVHPRYLDSAGLTAAWREALLARRVLQDLTRGYRHHPQLARFRAHEDPLACIESYLGGVLDEAQVRGFRFDATKIARPSGLPCIEETAGQLAYEWAHLKAKLHTRAPGRFLAIEQLTTPEAHPLFRIVPGEVRPWEVARSGPPGFRPI